MDFLKALLFFLGLAVVSHFYNKWAYGDKDDKGPEMTAPVTVTAKRIAQGRYLGTAPSRWNYMVTFTLSDGEELELYVTNSIFSTLKEGQTGLLKWQGKQFRHFDPDITP